MTATPPTGLRPLSMVEAAIPIVALIVLAALASGYTSTKGYEAIDMLASRGGMGRMLDTTG